MTDDSPDGSPYSHAFAVPGRFVYVRVSHTELGMIGEVRVET